LISIFSGIYVPEKHLELDENNDMKIESISRNNNLIDIPAWKINDRWNYNGYLDMVDFIVDSGVNTDLQTLTGTLQSTVTDIYVTTVDNSSSLVYEVQSQGYYEANNINLDGQPGDLEVNMDTISIIRASDLATVSQEATIDINFCRDFLWWCIDVSVGTLEVDQSYSPPLEGYDFPLSVGESWSQDYTATTTYDGSSDYVDIPEDTVSQRTANYEVVSQGFSGVNYASCATSYNISSTNADGEDTGYKWFCPAVRGDVKMETIESLGFTAVHSLSSYQATSRQKVINIDVEFPLSPIDMEISAWVNVSNNNGNPLANEQLQFRYEIEGDIQTITTASNGSAHVTFNTGTSADNSDSGDDLGSHGILAWINSANPHTGASTVTIDPNVYEIDLYVNQDGVSVERTRENLTLTLDENVGFNAIRDDAITFSIPVINRGLRVSPPTVLQIEGPDGTFTNANIPALSSLEEARVEVSWTVPSNQPFGDTVTSFNINIDDGDTTNNDGEFILFIGSAPVAILSMVEEILTLDEVSISGINSYDPDGGDFYCTFSLENLEGNIVSSEEEDCIYEYIWDDDGIFTVNMVVTDGENDFHSVSSDITVLNRNPEIILEAESETIPVLSPITFEITDRIDLDTQTPNAPVDIIWNAPCEQGTTLGIKCTVTLDQEGPYTIQVDATDDDGATITEEYTIQVTNIAPYNPEWEVKFEGNRLIPNSFGLYTVNEGDQLTVRGWAQDSENDMTSLRHVWAPDAEEKPDLEIIQQDTAISQIEIIYETDGQHIATFQVFDNDDESTDLMTVPFRVNNVEPTIRPFSQPLPVAEDQNIEISIIADDTLNDLQTLVPCYDLDPLVNSDNQGSETDDCDIESFNLIYSWPDSNTAPEKIIFHVTDNDGAVASAEINIDVRNVKPNPGMTTSEYNPTSGDVVILTGNGTTDSVNDMENMVYSWDMDISKDSNGDGDKTNDQDILGKIVEWEFNDAGSIVVQLTVDDGDSADSMRITIQVKEKPFSVTAFILSPIGILIIAILILSIAALPAIMKKRNKIEHDEFKVPSKGTIDDAFDDPEYDPFSDDSKKQKISKQRIKKEQNKPDSKTDQLDKDLILDKNIDMISDNDSENIDLEDKNLAINEVLTASEIEELIGEEE
tara:strand:+ start:1023 stop:4445 length:3423 start_codon:yes stop_codon:yes gene_type:complete